MISAVPVLSRRDRDALHEAVMSVRVLVVGSLNVDLILMADQEPEDDGAVLVRSQNTEAGGHAGNCAAALAALGVSVAVAGAVGSDADGDLLVDDLRARGVDVTGIRRRDGQPTGRVIIPVFGERHYMLLCRGANDTFTGPDLGDVLRGTDYDALLMFDPGRDALRHVGTALAATARRPLLCWTPGGIFCADPVAGAVLPHCEVVFVNRFERRRLVETTAGPLAGIDVVVTLGPAGSMLSRDEVEVTVAVNQVPVIDPTGAGDAFAAAYLLAQLAGLAPAQRLAAGNACGALAVGVTGARSRPASLTDLLAPLTGGAR